MDNATIAELLEKNRGAIERQLTEEFAKRVSESLSWTMQTEITKYAQEYISKNVLPDVQKQLQEQHSQIVTTMVAGVKTGVDLLGQRIAQKISENLKSDWNVAKVVKEMIG